MQKKDKIAFDIIKNNITLNLEDLGVCGVVPPENVASLLLANIKKNNPTLLRRQIQKVAKVI